MLSQVDEGVLSVITGLHEKVLPIVHKLVPEDRGIARPFWLDERSKATKNKTKNY